MVVMVCLMLLFFLALGGLLIAHGEQQTARAYQSIQQQHQARYQFIVETFASRLVIWAESVTHFLRDDERLELKLEQATFFQQFHWQIEQSWLILDDDTVSYGDELILNANDWQQISLTRLQLQPTYRIDCLSGACYFVVGLPVRKSKDTHAIYLMRSSMQEILALLGKAAQSRVALVDVDTDEKQHVQVNLIGEVNHELETFYDSIMRKVNRQNTSTLYSTGMNVKDGDASYHVMLMPLAGSKIDIFSLSEAQGYYILVVDDVTELANTAKRNQLSIIIAALVLFVVFSVSIYLLLHRYGKKLMTLSRRLPLLAKREYDAFRTHQIHNKPKPPTFHDELDILESAADDLALQLEALDYRVEQHTAKLEKLAMFDALTGLPNRNALTQKLERLIAELSQQNEAIALLFVDLDDFKKVNDSYGHDVGDKLLFNASKRMTSVITEGQIVARFGGDEFVVVLAQSVTRERVEMYLHSLLNKFNEPVKIDTFSFYMSLSVGVAISPATAVTTSDLLRHADIAMYEAKKRQGSSYRIFDSTMNRKVMQKVEIESEARIALRENHFFLALQPQLSLHDHKLVGFEALIRWQHPQKGLIPPGDFIPALENTAFMVQLDFWVLERGIQLLNALDINGYHDVKLAVNISASQFVDINLIEFLTTKLKQYQVNPALIELELTETALVADIERTTKVMSEIRALGCQIAIDDFGTGYSSLSYLKSIPADLVKIDRSFIADMMQSDNNNSIVASTIKMVKSMGLSVIAEGIETKAQYARLIEFECDYGQGYLMGKPIPEKQLWQTLATHCQQNTWRF